MKYLELDGKNVRIYFKTINSFEGISFYTPYDVKVGELKINNSNYELYEIMLDINHNELISESPYIFNEGQMDLIQELN